MTMIGIRICQEKDIAALNKAIVSHGDWHRKRFEAQRQGGTNYLIAWEGDIPVGHLNLIWSGSDQAQVHEYVQDCPELSAIWVWPPEKRSSGIGKKLIAQAEELVASKGYAKVGLGVRITNERAKNLYEKLGYKDWKHGIYRNCYTNFNRDGTKVEHDDPSYYLIKNL